MANSKSAIKRVRVNERNHLRGQALRSRLKTMIKKFETTLESKDIEAAKTSLSTAYKELDKAVSKGIIKKNTASRKKSRLTLQLNKAINA